METTQPQYKISGKKRQELKFVVDCIKRIYNYYHDEANEAITEPPKSPFTDEERTFLYDRVKYSRDWLWKFHEIYSNLNI